MIYTILQLLTSALTLSSQTPNFLNHRCWCHLTNTLKTYSEQGNCQIFYVMLSFSWC